VGCVEQLQRECDRLGFALVRAKQELQISERHVVGLKIALSARLKRIDQLTAQVDQLRQQNQKLDAEAEHLTAIIRSEGFILHANPQGRG
jgi:hypothetical protein